MSSEDLWEIFGTISELLGCPRGVSERSLGGLEEALGTSRGDLGAHEQNEHVESVFGPPFWSQNGLQNGAKINKTTLPTQVQKLEAKQKQNSYIETLRTSISYGFTIQSLPLLLSPNIQKNIKRLFQHGPKCINKQ